MRVSSIPLAALLFGLPALCAVVPLPPTLHLIPQPADFDSVSVSVRCTGCNWYKDAEDEAGVPYQSGLESDLVFNIHIPHDRQTLKINNAEFFPLVPSIALSALQVPAIVTPADYFALSHPFRNLKIDYDVLVANIPSPHANTKEIKVHLRFTSIGGVRNNGIEEIQIALREDTSTMKLKIISVTRMPVGSIEENDDADCHGWLECAMDMMHRKSRDNEISDCHHEYNHMGDYPGNRGYNGGDHMEGWEGKHMGDGRRMKDIQPGGDHMEGWEGKHMGDGRRMKDSQRGGDHMEGNHRGEGRHMGDGQHMEDGQRSHRSGGHMEDGQRSHRSGDHMEETHAEDNQHMRGDYMEGNHMKNSQHMKDNYRGHMKDNQGHRSHHEGDWANHIAGSHGDNHIGYCRQHSGPHISQWRNSSRPTRRRVHFFTRLMRRVLMPILVGILAGAGVSLAGLVFGKSVRKLYLATKGGCRSVKHKEEKDGADEEKGLLKGMEAREELAALAAAIELTAERPPAYMHEGVEVV